MKVNLGKQQLLLYERSEMAAILHMQNGLNKHALYYNVIKVKRKSSFI